MAEKLVIFKEILQHEINGLPKILLNEKKCQKKNKKMGLMNKNKLEQTMFFLLIKIETA